tara:strand:+ start:69 stop:521 length:453 start_codon:yes stop_codon:yes gene_type:complete
MNKTISDEYLKLQKKLHKNPNYGIASIKFAPNVKKILEDAKLNSISDYGAGKKNLQKKLIELGLKDFKYYPYDPAFPEYGKPKEADLVCCIDVLEHAEEDYLDNILDDLKKITKKFGFYTIHTGPALKVLADGRNAHLIQKPPSWWLPKM